MREFQFSLSYQTWVDEYADTLRRHDSLRSEAIVSCLDPTELWRLELVTGDTEALEALDPLLTDESLDRESISARDCRARRCHSVIESDATHRIVYTYVGDVSYCDAVPLIAAQYLDGGSLFEVVRADGESHWRVLMQDDETVGMVYDTLTGRLADGITFEFGHLEPAVGWRGDLLGVQSLPEEQRELLELAVERGYFETPREVTLSELADELELPRSTASYRLRRAVAELATGYVNGWY
jgi:predicted DNA binding protein